MNLANVTKAVAENSTYAGALRALGIQNNTYNRRELQGFCATHNINTDHFKGSGWRKGQKRFGDQA